MRRGFLAAAALLAVAGLAAGSDQRPPAPSRAPRTGGKTMTREDADRMAKAILKAAGAEGPGLNEKGLGGAMLGQAQVYFEHQAQPPAFVVRAHVYTFRKEPAPALLQALEAEGRKPERTGGGRLEYVAQNRGVFLTRSYERPVADEALVADVRSLSEASLAWRNDVLPKAMEASRPKPN